MPKQATVSAKYEFYKDSGFAHKTLLAFRAGDGDFSLTPWDTNLLTALGTIVIAVLPVFAPVQKGQKFPIFLITAVGVPGKAAKQRPKHKAVGANGQKQLSQRVGNKHSHHAENQTCDQNDGIEFVCAVAPGHEPDQPLTDFSHE